MHKPHQMRLVYRVVAVALGEIGHRGAAARFDATPYGRVLLAHGKVLRCVDAVVLPWRRLCAC